MKVITLDVKSKIFAQYFGSEYIYKNEFGSFKGTIEFGHNTKSHIENKNSRILLKKLINISDEDAIEMAKIFGGIDGEIILNRPTDLQNNDIHFSVQVYTEEPKFTSYTTPKYWMDGYGVKPYQWLVSKGYALPYMDYSVEDLVELGVYKLK